MRSDRQYHCWLVREEKAKVLLQLASFPLCILAGGLSGTSHRPPGSPAFDFELWPWLWCVRQILRLNRNRKKGQGGEFHLSLMCLFFFDLPPHCVQSGQAETAQRPFVELLAHPILNSRLLSLPGGCFSELYSWFVIRCALRQECRYHSQDFLSVWHLAAPASIKVVAGCFFLMQNKLSRSLKKPSSKYNLKVF